jgi:hypothetical protein
MDNVQNCDSYINIPSSQTYRYYKLLSDFSMLATQDTNVSKRAGKSLSCSCIGTWLPSAPDVY